jgi:hypothetical protein
MLPADETAADFIISAITAPQNAVKVETAMKEELQRALKDGFPPDEGATSKKGWAEAQRVSRSQDQELAGRLRSHLHANRTGDIYVNGERFARLGSSPLALHFVTLIQRVWQSTLHKRAAVITSAVEDTVNPEAVTSTCGFRKF